MVPYRRLKNRMKISLFLYPTFVAVAKRISLLKYTLLIQA